jgi:hypothetical protein
VEVGLRPFRGDLVEQDRPAVARRFGQSHIPWDDDLEHRTVEMAFYLFNYLI